MNAKESTVLIVEPDLDIQRTYRKCLIHDPDIRLVGICSSMASATALLAQTGCDILFTELDLPDGDGLGFVKAAKKELGINNVVVISSRTEASDVVTSVENGAVGYIIKSENALQSIAEHIRTVIAGASPISPLAARALVNTLQTNPELRVLKDHSQTDLSSPSPLSPRESEVLDLLAMGMSFQEISKKLSISTHTVTAHIKKIYRKLHVHSRGEAVYEATKQGFLFDR